MNIKEKIRNLKLNKRRIIVLIVLAIICILLLIGIVNFIKLIYSISLLLFKYYFYLLD